MAAVGRQLQGGPASVTTGLGCFWAQSQRGRGGGVQRVSLSSLGKAGTMAGAGFRNWEAGAATLYF